MNYCGERQCLPASDLDNKEMSLFWVVKWQIHLYHYSAWHCHTQAPPSQSLKSAHNHIWITSCAVSGITLAIHTRADWALPWSLCPSPLSSQLIRTANQAVVADSSLVFYSCLIILLWDGTNWFWRFISLFFSKSKYFLQQCHLFCPVLLLISI